jgi:hypothetical protein
MDYCHEVARSYFQKSTCTHSKKLCRQQREDSVKIFINSTRCGDDRTGADEDPIE